MAFILEHPSLAKEARNLRRMYGPYMYIEYLRRKAEGELGTGRLQFTVDDIARLLDQV